MLTTLMQLAKKICIVWFFGISVSCIYSQSVTLKNALKTTFTNNLDLKTTQYDYLISQTDIITAGLRPNPKLNNQTLLLVDPPYFAQNVPWNSNKNRQDWWQLTKEIQWPGVRKWKMNTSQKETSVVQNEFDETTRSILYNAASQWLNVWVKTKQLFLISEAKTNIDSLVAVNTYRQEKQTITLTDLTRTQILKGQYDILYKKSIQQLQNEHRSLQLLMGVSDSVVVDTSMNLIPISENLDSLRNFALRSRPDIRMVKSEIDFSVSNIKLQNKLAFPRIELGVIWNPQNTIQYVGFFGTIDLPFFSRNQGERRKSTILKQKFEQNLASTEWLVNTEVTNAYNAYQTNKKNLLSYQEILDQSQTVLESVLYAYNRGATNIIDYLEAQRSWLDIRTTYLETLGQYYQSYIDLLQATGQINTIIND